MGDTDFQTLSNAYLNAVWESKAITSPTQKLVMACLADHANESGECWPSLSRISEHTALSRTAVCEAIRSLKEVGILSVKPAMRPSSTYAIHRCAMRTSTPAGLVRLPDGGSAPGVLGVVRLPDGGSAPGVPKPSVNPQCNHQGTVAAHDFSPALPQADLLTFGGLEIPTITQKPHSEAPAKNGKASKKKVETTDEEWIRGLESDPGYPGVNIRVQLARWQRWCKTHRKIPTRRRFEAWLNRDDPVTTAGRSLLDSNIGTIADATGSDVPF